MSEIGDRIKACRGSTSLRKLADAASISIGTLRNIESGKTEQPDAETLSCIAQAFAIEVSALWDPTGPTDQPVIARAVVPTAEVRAHIRLSTRDTLAVKSAIEIRGLEDLAAEVLNEWAVGTRRKSASIKEGVDVIASARESE